MSPEQARGEELDARTDLFSLGVVVYEMATGRHAFTGSTSAVIFDAILHKAPTSPVRLNPDIPAELEQAINKCLEKDKDLRYQHASDLRTDLKRLKRDTTSGESVAGPAARLGPRLRGLLPWIAAGGLVVAGTLGWWLLSSRTAKPPTEAPLDPVQITPFTSDGGEKRHPELSPDGEKVAYAWTGTADDNWDIYVKGLGIGAKPLRLTEHPADDQSPAWSPDERQVAFVRRPAEGGAAIYTVPSLGGQERKLVDVSHPAHAWLQPGLSWSPDGDSLVFAEKGSPDDPARIVRVSLATLEKQSLTSPPADSLGDLGLAISPDGRQLAFVRSATTAWGNLDVWVQPWEGGQARRLTFEKYGDCHGLAWTPDGTEIVFTTTDPSRIVRVSLAGGDPRPLVGTGENASNASIRADRMVYEQWAVVQGDIWRVPGRKASASGQEPERLIASSRADFNPSYSPDGRRIAFVSLRTGQANIWVCDSDGSNPFQLTDFEHWASTPRWSPDGHRLVFDSLEGENWDLYLVDADGGVPRRLTLEGSAENVGTWSRDGERIYFTSDRSGERQIWKMPSEGGPAVQVTRGGGFYAEESLDGRHLYYANRSDDPGVWRMPVAGGQEVEVVPSGLRYWAEWALSKDGIYYATRVPRTRGEEYTIRFLDFQSGEVTELFRKEGPFAHGWLAVSPDEEWVLYKEESAPQSELMLVENCR